MYSASKHAVKGFTDSLRMEIEKDDVPISVTLIKPAGIDTMFTSHARQRDLGRAVRVQQAVGLLEGVGELRVAEAAEQRGVDDGLQQLLVQRAKVSPSVIGGVAPDLLHALFRVPWKAMPPNSVSMMGWPWCG
jgi:short-subunit dehydrogenase